MTLILLYFGLHANAATPIKCFSKYYTENNVLIQLTAIAVSDTELKNFTLEVEDYDFFSKLKNLTNTSGYHPHKYKGFQRFVVPNNLGDGANKTLSVLLPEKLMSVKGRFDAYVSDANADNSGSDGYYRVLCQSPL